MAGRIDPVIMAIWLAMLVLTFAFWLGVALVWKGYL